MYSFYLIFKGFETAKALSLHGCHIVMACRDVGKGEKAAESIRKGQVGICRLNLKY